MLSRNHNMIMVLCHFKHFPLFYSQLVDYEVPFIALASLSLLAALVIPVVGLIFCCCRFLGKCGGHVVDHGEIKRHPTKERIAYSIGIIICVVFLL